MHVYSVVGPMRLRLLNLTLVFNRILVDINAPIPADSDHVPVETFLSLTVPLHSVVCVSSFSALTVLVRPQTCINLKGSSPGDRRGTRPSLE